MALDVAFYNDIAGHTPVSEFLFSLSEKERNKCFQYIDILSEFGNRLTSQYVKHIEGDSWELRPEFGGVEMRLFCFIWTGDLIVFLHGFKKKSQKTPSRKLAVAKRRMESLL